MMFDHETAKRDRALAGLIREDGRPEVYDTPADFRGKCVVCIHKSAESVVPEKSQGEIFMGSPVDFADGAAHLICKDCLPDDVVIFDPVSNMCRDKTGQNVWTEEAQ